MTKTLAEARTLRRGARRGHDPRPVAGVQPFVVPPATALTTVRDALPPSSGVVLGAQNAHWEDAGAWTGEVSVPQVADAGASLVEIGHSERREHFGDTDDVVRRKVAAVLRHGLVPLLCVGEPDEVKLAGSSVEHVLGADRGGAAPRRRPRPGPGRLRAGLGDRRARPPGRARRHRRGRVTPSRSDSAAGSPACSTAAR